MSLSVGVSEKQVLALGVNEVSRGWREMPIKDKKKGSGVRQGEATSTTVQSGQSLLCSKDPSPSLRSHSWASPGRAEAPGGLCWRLSVNCTPAEEDEFSLDGDPGSPSWPLQ